VPVRIHRQERPQDFDRFKAHWTPTVIVAQADGTEVHRSVGFQEMDEFLTQLHMGLAKAEFAREKYQDAERTFRSAAKQFPYTFAAPEALYWATVSAYKATGKEEDLKKGGLELMEKYPQSEWAMKGMVWLD
jgi:TolA-binding protein